MTETEKDYWQAWARKRLEMQRKYWLRAAKSALAGDMRELRNRVELSEAEPMDIVQSAPPAPAEAKVDAVGEVVACPCTMFEQDEDCPEGYPSMLCGICNGTGNAPKDQVTALAVEMLKIASDMGEPEDPFAAWESIELIKSQNDQMDRALNKIAGFTSRCEHDGGFDREIGPIGCNLGEKCVCIGIHPIARAALLPSPSSNALEIKSFQQRVAHAHHALFDDDPTDVEERRARFYEEATETAQAFGMSAEDMHKIVDYSCSRPVGEPAKEIGAAMVTLASLCVVAGFDLSACAEADLEKLQRPETIARIKAKRGTRHGRGPLPGFDPALSLDKEGEKK